MAAKPTIANAAWATDANYPAGSEPEQGTPTKIATTAPQKAVGWRPEEKPPAQNWNRWNNEAYQWFQYLDEGQFVGNHTITGSLHVTTTLDIDGVATVNDLLVEDDATVTDDLTVQGSLLGNGSDPVLAPNSVESPRFYHTTPIPLKISAAASIEFGTPVHTRAGSGLRWLVAASAGTEIVYPISLPNGAVIVSWELYIDKTSSGTAHARIFRQHDDANTSAAIGTDQTIATTPGETFFSESIGHTIDAAYSYAIVFTPSGNANDLLGHAVVYYTFPAP